MSKEVSCKNIIVVLKAIQNRKLPLKKYLKGIPYSLEHLQNKHERVEWSVYCQLIKNIRTDFSNPGFKFQVQQVN